MHIHLANPRGFCAGVERAITAVEQALRIIGPPLYVYHEIVHNQHVVQRFRSQGVIFVDDLTQVPSRSVVVYSAHGVSPQVRQLAQERRLRTIDATCPLVTKVHSEAIRYVQQGYRVLLVGHAGHDEVVGTLGEAPNAIQVIETMADAEHILIPPGHKVAYVTQTTLSRTDVEPIIECLKDRFPDIEHPAKDDICYATQNRQQALAALAADADLVLVIGSANSSNSQRLAELASQQRAPVYLINGVTDLKETWFKEVKTVAITAGASTPEEVISEVVQCLAARYHATIEEQKNPPEAVHFPLPAFLTSLPLA